jgi:hypothetical protein
LTLFINEKDLSSLAFEHGINIKSFKAIFTVGNESFNFDTVNTSKKLSIDNFSSSEKYFIIVLNCIISFSSSSYKHYKYLLIALIFLVKYHRQFLSNFKKKTQTTYLFQYIHLYTLSTHIDGI